MILGINASSPKLKKHTTTTTSALKHTPLGGWLMNGSGTILPNDAPQKATISSFTRYAIAMIQMS